MLNNRDYILLLILIAFMVFLFYKKETRILLLNLLKQLLNRKLILPIACMLVYIGLFTSVFFKFGLWDWSLLKDTIVWIGIAFVMLFNYGKISDNFTKYLKENFKFVIVLEFIVGIYVFNIFGELLLIPIVIILTLINAVARNKEEYKPIEKITNTILAIIGLYILYHAILQCISGFQNFLSLHNLKSFLLPIIFTILFIPFVYLFALIAEYESLFVRIDNTWFKNNKELSMYAKRQVIITCFLKLKMVKLLSQNKAMSFINAKSKSDIKKILN